MEKQPVLLLESQMNWKEKEKGKKASEQKEVERSDASLQQNRH